MACSQRTRKKRREVDVYLNHLEQFQIILVNENRAAICRLLMESRWRPTGGPGLCVGCVCGVRQGGCPGVAALACEGEQVGK